MRLAALTFVPFLVAAGVALAADPPPSNEAQQPPASTQQPNAQTPAPNAQAPDQAGQQGQAPAPVTDVTPPGAPGGTPASPSANATSPEAAKAQAELNRIRAKANEGDAKEREVTEKSLKETAAQVDAATAKKEKVEVAGRLAAEYGGTPELYVGERDRLKTGWGELSIAHMILSNSKTIVTIDQLYDLRQEGLGWGQIAHGLDLNGTDFAKSARTRGLAAVGAAPKGDQVQAKAGGKAAKGTVKAKGDVTAKGEASAKSAKAAEAVTPETPAGTATETKK